MLNELLQKNRSYRRFDEGYEIPKEVFVALTEALRYTASAANLQRVRVFYVTEPALRQRVFETLGFAAYLKNWDGPAPGERPTAYAVLLTEEEPNSVLSIDVGLCAQSMLLSACEKGLGGCIFGSFCREKLLSALEISGYHPSIVIALGKPAETVRITDMVDGDVKYYRNELDEHIVPKRSIEELSLTPLF